MYPHPLTPVGVPWAFNAFAMPYVDVTPVSVNSGVGRFSTQFQRGHAAVCRLAVATESGKIKRSKIHGSSAYAALL